VRHIVCDDNKSEVKSVDNTRKVGGGRKPSKPEYSATKNLVQQMEAAAELYTAYIGAVATLARSFSDTFTV